MVVGSNSAEPKSILGSGFRHLLHIVFTVKLVIYKTLISKNYIAFVSRTLTLAFIVNLFYKSYINLNIFV